jgi:hypothetical protein
MTNWMKKFDREITVAMEGLVWAKPRRYWSNGPSKDEQSVFRIVRAGKVSVDGMASGTAWEDTDVDIDMEGPDLVEPKRTAKWRKWWRTKDVKHFM